MVCLLFVPAEPYTSNTSSTRGQFYKPTNLLAQNDQPEINENQNARVLGVEVLSLDDSNEDESDTTSSTSIPYAAVGQYSKSVLVNTQSVAHSYIYDPEMPIFDLDHSSNVTALLDKTAVLNCRVRNIGNKTVSIFQLHKITRRTNFLLFTRRPHIGTLSYIYVGKLN